MKAEYLKFKEGQDYPEQANRLPQAFFRNPKYKKMSTDARYLYMIFTLKMTNSPSNGWVDSDGNMYIVYPDKVLMNEMNCSSFTVNKLKNELIDHDLLLEKSTPAGNDNRLYPLRVSEIYV